MAGRDLRSLRAELVPVIRRLPAYIRLALLLYGDRRLGRLHRLAVAAALAYSLSPVDLVPGVIPVLGQLDDVIVLLSILRSVLLRRPGEVSSHLVSMGLTLQALEEDLARVKAVAAALAAGAGRLAARGVRGAARVAGKAAARFGRAMSRSGKRRS